MAKFFEAHQLAPGETVAKDIVIFIDQLFAIDAQARAQDCDVAARRSKVIINIVPS